MRGRPVWMKCGAWHRGDEHHDLSHRTGRTKPNRSHRRQGQALDEAHEYVCSCGRVGWSTHSMVEHLPVRQGQP